MCLRLTLCLLVSIAIMSCNNSSADSADGNSIYYWRTTFKLSEAERGFLDRHNVKRIYMRFFDVSENYEDNYGPVPDATIIFEDTIPNGIEIVPTVYITLDAICGMNDREDVYAEKILKRVKKMCQKNGIKFNELQLDCDWTESTCDRFFKLCAAVKQGMEPSQLLSNTIRLHQLTQSPPPVDKGVLMVYNTGDLRNENTENSILSLDDVEPYLSDNRLAEYELPLDVAYPAYGWCVLYGKTQYGSDFLRLMPEMDLSSDKRIEKIDDNLYQVTSTVSFSDFSMVANEGLRIRVERPSASEILKVKRMIDRQLKGKTHNNILYHLDENQLSHYGDDEISEIYTCN